MSSPLLVGPWWWKLLWRLRNPCYCKRQGVVPKFDCPRHRTETRGYCTKCKRYDLVFMDGDTFCASCGAGPLVPAYHSQESDDAQL